MYFLLVYVRIPEHVRIHESHSHPGTMVTIAKHVHIPEALWFFVVAALSIE